MKLGPLFWLVALSVVFLALRAWATVTVGFGDSEALYACYALHPQAAYLDHPGLIGLFARIIAAGSSPTPFVAHVATSLLATGVPWLAVLAARAAGSSWRGAFACGVAVAAVPEMAVGLFAMTPDLLLSLGWLGALGLAAAALGSRPGSTRAAAFFLGAGLVAGIAVTAKVSAMALVIVFLVTLASRAARPHARTPWPWIGIALGLVAFLPVIVWEAQHGAPMLRHRLIDTQDGGGFSAKNLAAVPLGQLVYVSPLFVVATGFVARDLWQRRHDGDPVTVLLALAFLLPVSILLPFCLWAKNPEPHWLAPALLSLPLHFARRPEPIVPRRLGIAAVATGALLSVFVHAWVLLPALSNLVPAKAYGKPVDLPNELYGWRELAGELRGLTERIAGPRYEPGDIVIVGPHWTVCAQLQANLRAFIPVGCDTPIPDDWDGWLRRERWRESDTVLYVTDDRFDVDPAQRFEDRVPVPPLELPIIRGDRVVRTFKVWVLRKRHARA